MATDFATSAQMSTNGAPIGLTQITIEYRRSEILKDRRVHPTARPVGQNASRRLAVHLEADPGVISRKCRVAPHAQAFLQNFSMQITDFVSPAMSAINLRTSRPSQYSAARKMSQRSCGSHAVLYEHNTKGQPPNNFSS
jgi:hypothetical protein